MYYCSISVSFENIKLFEPPHDKTNKMTVRPAKTQISLGSHPVWSESSLCAQWVAKNPSFLHAPSKDSDQTGRMPRLIWGFAWSTCHFVGFVMRWLNVSLLQWICSNFFDLINVSLQMQQPGEWMWRYEERKISPRSQNYRNAKKKVCQSFLTALVMSLNGQFSWSFIVRVATLRMLLNLNIAIFKKTYLKF